MTYVGKTLLTLAALLLTAGAINSGGNLENRISQSPQQEVKVKESKSYEQILKEIQSDRSDFNRIYQQANQEEKKKVIGKARDYIFDRLVDDIFPAWYGTTWNFFGKTKTPGEGGIACGVFVGRTLNQVGFNFSPVAVGSETYRVIRWNLLGKDGENSYGNLNDNKSEKLNKIVEDIKKQGKGVYLVGLDNHGGFAVNDGENINFVHSSYYSPPNSVTSQSILSNSPLTNSGTLEFQSVLNDKMVEKWIKNEFIPHRYHVVKEGSKYKIIDRGLN